MSTSIKFQSFTTDAGHTPNYGDVSADFRGPLAIGAKDGDGHHTFAEIKNASPELVTLMLSVAPTINQKAKDGSPAQLVALLESHLPAEEKHIIDAIISAVGGIPTLRVGIWDAHG